MYLGINTATDALGVALVEDGRVLAEAVRDVGTEHSEAIFELLETVFAWSGRSRNDLRGIGVALGPGGFTGVRTGLALAKTIAQVKGLPVYGIDTLAALALQFGGSWPVAPMLDARRGLVFGGLFVLEDGAPVARLPGAMLALEDWLAQLAGEGPLVVVGEGAIKYREQIGAALPRAWVPADVLMAARAVPVALQAELRGKRGEPGGGPDLAPQYLREPSAVLNWEAAQEKAP